MFLVMDFSPLFILHKICTWFTFNAWAEKKSHLLYSCSLPWLHFSSQRKVPFSASPQKSSLLDHPQCSSLALCMKGVVGRWCLLSIRPIEAAYWLWLVFNLSHKPQFPRQFPFMLFYPTPKSPLSQHNESQCSWIMQVWFSLQKCQSKQARCTLWPWVL